VARSPGSYRWWASVALAVAIVLATASTALASQIVVPNDPSFGMQWGLQNTGQTVNGATGTPGADIDATEAWAVTTGDPAPVIVVLDSGVDLDHPDLAPNIWTNPGGIGGCDAGTHGYNVVPKQPTCDPSDDLGHGTHVAGIVGAVGNDGTGIAGVDWHATILPVKFISSLNKGPNGKLVKALDWILQIISEGVNVRVVNDSGTWAGTAYSTAVFDRLQDLSDQGVLFVSAAGNTKVNIDNKPRYPCSYQVANEVCVTATDQNDALWAKSNWGPSTVDLAAPGVNIYSTLPEETYGFISGGSMAAPLVSGAAMLALAQDPTLTASALKARLLGAVVPLPSLVGKVRTGGRLNLCLALVGCPVPSP
jgi:subtilisin family serine protease